MSTNLPNRIKLNDVRLSYPSLFRMTVNPKSPPNTPPKYEATFILDKDLHSKEINLINEQVDLLLKEMKVSRDKILPLHFCLKDGDLSDREEYKNSYIIKARTSNKYPIVGKDGKIPVSENDNIFYGGCYVSSYISLYKYDKFSIGIGANLNAIQFRKDGPTFNNTMQDIEGAFDPIEDEDSLF